MGELYLAGPWVVDGYYTAPPAQQKKFQDGSSSDLKWAPPLPPGCRVFQTGDLAVWREDRALALIGRSDDLVNVNGVRVELDDVTACALACRGVVAAQASSNASPYMHSPPLHLAPPHIQPHTAPYPTSRARHHELSPRGHTFHPP